LGALGTVFRLGRLGDASAWRSLAESAGLRHGVDPALILAVIDAESSGNPRASNPDDPSYGLMGL